MSKNTQSYLNQINDDYKFLYSMNLHKKMYKCSGGNLDFVTAENFRKLGKHAYYGAISNKVFPQFDGDQLLEDSEVIYNNTGSLKVGTTYVKVVSNKNNTEPFFISEDDIDVNYKFDTAEDGSIKTFGLGYPMVLDIKK